MNHRKMPRPSQRRRLPLSIKLRPLKIPKAKRSQRKSRSRKQQIALGMLAAMRCVTVERSIGRMTDVNQVRINELARELEVKAKAIIDLLPGYGVTEKKTHSSSIPVDVAEKVRKKLAGGGDGEDEIAAAVPTKPSAAPPAPSQVRPAGVLGAVSTPPIARPAVPSAIPTAPLTSPSVAPGTVAPGTASSGPAASAGAGAPSVAPALHAPAVPARPMAPASSTAPAAAPGTAPS